MPPDWKGEEVLLVWDSNSEAMIWSTDGKPLQGLTPENKRTHFVLTEKYDGSETRFVFNALYSISGSNIALLLISPVFSISLFVEMACNELFGAGEGSQIGPPNPNRTYTLKTAHITTRNRLAYQLYLDFEVLVEFVKVLSPTSIQNSVIFIAESRLMFLDFPEFAWRLHSRKTRSIHCEWNGQCMHWRRSLPRILQKVVMLH